jgi:hypothetical protein
MTAEADSYIVLGDVVASSRLPNRRHMPGQLRAACRSVNMVYRSGIHAPFALIKGIDELGGALSTLRDCYDIVQEFCTAVLPGQIRFVIARGAVDVGIRSREIGRMDGPVFATAATMMSRLKESGLLFDIQAGSDLDEPVAGLFNLLLVARRHWTARQLQVVRLYMKLGTQERVASELGVRQQNVSQALRAVDWNVLSRTVRILRNMLDRYPVLKPGGRQSR